jgi:hypothetical protein
MQLPPSFDDGRPPFDHAFANALVGKHVLVGVTYTNKMGEFKSQDQFHGVVQKVDPKDGILLLLKGELDGTWRWLPPDTRGFHAASPGEYRLRSNVEIVENPDYTSTRTIEQSDA